MIMNKLEKYLPTIEEILHISFDKLEEAGIAVFRAIHPVTKWILTLHTHEKFLILEDIPVLEGENYAVKLERVEMLDLEFVVYPKSADRITFVNSSSQLEFSREGSVLFIPEAPGMIVQLKNKKASVVNVEN